MRLRLISTATFGFLALGVQTTASATTIEQRYGEASAFLNSAFFPQLSLSQVLFDLAVKRQRDRCDELIARARETFRKLEVEMVEFSLLKSRTGFFAIFQEDDPEKDAKLRDELHRLRHQIPARKQELKHLDRQIEECESKLKATPASAKGRRSLADLVPADTRIVPVAGQPVSSEIPLTFFVTSGYSGLDDDRNNTDRNADAFQLGAGIAAQLSDRLTIGAQFQLVDGVAKSNAIRAKLQGTYYGVTVFGAYAFNDFVSLNTSAGYMHGDNSVRLDLASGSFESHVYSASASLVGKFELEGITVSPDAGVNLSHVDNTSTVFTNAIGSDATSLTHAIFQIGGTLSRVFVEDSMTLTPSVGVHAAYKSRSGDNLTLTNFSTVGEEGAGVVFDGGLTAAFSNGISAGITGNYAIFGKVDSYGASFNLALPLN